MPRTNTIWDYNTSKIDLKNPFVMKWYLERKINCGDFSGILRKDLEKFLPRLEISASMRELITYKLKADAKEKAPKN